MPPRKSDVPSLPTPIESLKHPSETRRNTPTAELSGLMEEEERSPKTLRYPRDPSLDPQLVWNGKDDQDGRDLEVPSVPIYVQEKIHPQAIIEGLRTDAARDNSFQASLFADFNGITFEQMVEFYQHEQHWSNRMILGDSLLVMASLAEKENLKGRVQMVYIDPPYGIKFGSNWQVSTRKRDVKDSKAEHMTRQPEQIRAFRDTWEKGIHSYLSYLRDRLVATRELLSDAGSVFVQIGDENVHLVRSLLDEVFGSENFISQIIFKKTSGQSSAMLANLADHILWYAKNKETAKFRPLFERKEPREQIGTFYDYLELFDGSRHRLTQSEVAQLRVDDGRVFQGSVLYSEGATSTGSFSINVEGLTFEPPSKSHWKTSHNGMQALLKANRIFIKGNTPRYVRYFEDFPYFPQSNIWSDTSFGGFVGDQAKIYVVQTYTKVVERCLLMTTDPGDLVLDPTTGSATTAYVAEQWGRRWITCDTSRVALALARTRLMGAKYPYYVLADSYEGISKEAELTSKMPSDAKPEGDIKRGFVYKRVPHVTLKSIANNLEIDGIYDGWQKSLEPLRVRLNEILNQQWEEWEIPKQIGDVWSDEAKGVFSEWWRLQLERQHEIDASIAHNAEREFLYDQPYEDSKRIRVTGPFTVESLSPHRVVSFDDAEQPKSEAAGQELEDAERFVSTILDNLMKAGVQNTKHGERIQFDRLDAYPGGSYIQGYGEYTEQSGVVRRVAVCIGPKYGTVGQELIRNAVKEAGRGIGFDILLMCGFAFDPYAAETRRMGRLLIIPVKMNPDLTMGEELLKKTSAANLFMVFGEPDVTVSRTPQGKVEVEVHGVDIYNPTTGEMRSSSTDDIACWFIDTEYNEESFFVRHAYFTGADQPYEKLKRALRAEVDEEAWASLYSTKSRPFDPPTTGKIAVKVINHYGDEVLKVYTL